MKAKTERVVVAALLCLVSAACGGLSAEDVLSVRHAAVLSGMAYTHEDASTPTAALMRGAYCSDEAVLRRQKLPLVDAGINCDAP